MNTTPAELIDRYVKLRDELAELKADFKRNEDRVKDEMGRIEETLKNIMGQLGTESVRTGAGTAYLKENVFVSTSDKTAFFDYMKQNERWDLLDIRGSKSNIQDYMLEFGEVPPGIEVRRVLNVGIRRA